MVGCVAQLVEQGLDPSGGRLIALGVKVMGEAPEVLAAVIEVQGFGRLGEAVLNQVPYPDGAIGYDENFFGSDQARPHGLSLDHGSEIDDLRIWRRGDDFFFR